MCPAELLPLASQDRTPTGGAIGESEPYGPLQRLMGALQSKESSMYDLYIIEKGVERLEQDGYTEEQLEGLRMFIRAYSKRRVIRRSSDGYIVS